jgi:hypothetical protein
VSQASDALFVADLQTKAHLRRMNHSSSNAPSAFVSIECRLPEAVSAKADTLTAYARPTSISNDRDMTPEFTSESSINFPTAKRGRPPKKHDVLDLSNYSILNSAKKPAIRKGKRLERSKDEGSSPSYVALHVDREVTHRLGTPDLLDPNSAFASLPHSRVAASETKELPSHDRSRRGRTRQRSFLYLQTESVSAPQLSFDTTRDPEQGKVPTLRACKDPILANEIHSLVCDRGVAGKGIVSVDSSSIQTVQLPNSDKSIHLNVSSSKIGCTSSTAYETENTQNKRQTGDASEALNVVDQALCSEKMPSGLCALSNLMTQARSSDERSVSEAENAFRSLDFGSFQACHEPNTTTQMQFIDDFADEAMNVESSLPDAEEILAVSALGSREAYLQQRFANLAPPVEIDQEICKEASHFKAGIALTSSDYGSTEKYCQSTLATHLELVETIATTASASDKVNDEFSNERSLLESENLVNVAKLSPLETFVEPTLTSHEQSMTSSANKCDAIATDEVLTAENFLSDEAANTAITAATFIILPKQCAETDVASSASAVPTVNDTVSIESKKLSRQNDKTIPPMKTNILDENTICDEDTDEPLALIIQKIKSETMDGRCDVLRHNPVESISSKTTVKDAVSIEPIEPIEPSLQIDKSIPPVKTDFSDENTISDEDNDVPLALIIQKITAEKIERKSSKPLSAARLQGKREAEAFIANQEVNSDSISVSAITKAWSPLRQKAEGAAFIEEQVIISTNEGNCTTTKPLSAARLRGKIAAATLIGKKVKKKSGNMSKSPPIPSLSKKRTTGHAKITQKAAVDDALSDNPLEHFEFLAISPRKRRRLEGTILLAGTDLPISNEVSHPITSSTATKAVKASSDAGKKTNDSTPVKTEGRRKSSAWVRRSGRLSASVEYEENLSTKVDLSKEV